MARSQVVGVLLAAGLFALALAMHIPLLDAPVYGDEHLHFVTAAHPSDPTPNVVDLWGNPVGAPSFLFWQRPAAYAAFHLPATLGFDTYRAAHAVVASLVAPLGYWLLRGHAASRPAAVLGGLALAVATPLVVWGAFALMDVLVTVVLFAMLIARRARRYGVAAVLAVLAVWTKETAYAAVVVLFAIDLGRAVRQGRATVYPLRLGPQESSLAWPLVLGPLPLILAFAKGLPAPGGAAYGATASIVQGLLPTVWLLPLLVAGLWFRRSRFLSAAALAAFGAFVLLHAAGRSVEAWYACPAIAFAIVGCASATDAIARHAFRQMHGTPVQPKQGGGWGLRAAAAVAVVVAVGGTFGAALMPAGATRDLLYPLTSEPAPSLSAAYAFELHVRDQDLVTALAAVPLAEHPDVLFLPSSWPLPFVALQDARTVYVDWPVFRTIVDLDVLALAARIEDNATWTVLSPGEHPIQLAIREVYADCIVATAGAWQVLHAPACAGRGERLRTADRMHGGL